MNKYERRYHFQLDMIAQMIEYALNQNKDTESKEYSDALWEWTEKYFDSFKIKWEQNHGKLEVI